MLLGSNFAIALVLLVTLVGCTKPPTTATGLDHFLGSSEHGIELSTRVAKTAWKNIEEDQATGGARPRYHMQHYSIPNVQVLGTTGTLEIRFFNGTSYRARFAPNNRASAATEASDEKIEKEVNDWIKNFS